MHAALHAPVRRPAVLAEFDWPGGMERVWSGAGDLDALGQTFTGIGPLGQIAGLEQTGAVSIQEIVFSMSLLPADLAARYAGTGSLKGRVARVWYGLLDARGQIVPDPLLICRADLDYATARIEGGDAEDATGAAASVEVTATSGLWQLEKPTARAFTSAEQKRLYPDDTGYDRLPAQEGRKIVWSGS
jgi:hypothetical protein